MMKLGARAYEWYDEWIEWQDWKWQKLSSIKMSEWRKKHHRDVARFRHLIAKMCFISDLVHVIDFTFSIFRGLSLSLDLKRIFWNWKSQWFFIQIERFFDISNHTITQSNEFRTGQLCTVTLRPLAIPRIHLTQLFHQICTTFIAWKLRKHRHRIGIAHNLETPSLSPFHPIGQKVLLTVLMCTHTHTQTNAHFNFNYISKIWRISFVEIWVTLTVAAVATFDGIVAAVTNLILAKFCLL